MSENEQAYKISPIDENILDNLSDGVQNHKDAVMSLFFTNVAEFSDAIKIYVKNHNYEKCIAIAKDMMKLCNKIGASELSETCKSISELSKKDYFIKSQDLISKIDTDLEKIKVFIRSTGY